jgi:L-fuculose-phosphate aldolase
MATSEKALRDEIVASGIRLLTSGLTHGSSGNISARTGDAMLITPSAVPYPKLRPTMIARMPLGGEYGAWSGPLRPSNEWRIHLDVMRARPDVGAIVHCHSPYATALSMAHKPILAAHYMIALFGGPVIRCTKYAPYGTKDLSELAVEGLGDRHAVLLGNHGAIATGATLEAAMLRAEELENLARLYAIALTVGRPAILSDDEVGRLIERFKGYGAGQAAGGGGPAPNEKSRAKAKTTSRKRGAKKKAPGKKKAAAGAAAL